MTLSFDIEGIIADHFAGKAAASSPQTRAHNPQNHRSSTPNHDDPEQWTRTCRVFRRTLEGCIEVLGLPRERAVEIAHRGASMTWHEYGAAHRLPLEAAPTAGEMADFAGVDL